MAGRILALATLIPLAFGFQDTYPIVAWSSHKSRALDALPASRSSHSNVVYENILLQDDVCEHDAVVLIDQPGLHASDLRSLSSSSPLSSILSRSASSVQLPYVRQSSGSASVHDIADLLSERCGSKVLNFMPGQGSIEDAEKDKKHVMCMSNPRLDGMAGHRKGFFAELESTIVHDLESLASLFPKHLIIFSGSPSSPFERRQSPDFEDPLSEEDSLYDAPLLDTTTFIQSNGTLPEGGILKRYQLLTPALITSLLVALFVLLPVVMFGVSALASIQSPLRTEAPKGFNAQEKKMQ
ncbi:uncharacterized protein STEHIDRAFT_140117 [Stereum hirsutum FP-91666 SS1]|uniref:uncharacterized protein n=1 Tax=Stereum hirsutum (strain FP-91666) TaxID=721885 RepID=UPI000444990E|nr:uncharacterized protein STEHIDRAFT_140117 [Stereum hirsutum FP-91666 SS1]EIM85480.1 hypothetical protein STEHIDRAFT_140117 [Stereum hirsutum FP-91666 SS1]